jgi:cellulose biosynthesis protein BcsQ
VTNDLRDTFGVTDLQYRLRAAGSLLGVSDNTLRGYADTAGIHVKRASDITPTSPSIRVFDTETIFQLSAWRRAQGYIKGPAPGAMPVFITVDVVKGGTGKSTTAAELTLHLQFLGLRALLIDLDTQANATQLFGYEADLDVNEAGEYGLTPAAIVTSTFASVMLPFIEKQRGSGSSRIVHSTDFIKRPFGANGPAIIPADTYLGDVEQALANSKGHRELYVKQMLNAAYEGQVPGLNLKEFDVVVFDCPPSISYLSTNALAVADLVVAPIKMDSFSVKGLSKLVSEIHALDTAYSIKPELLILPTHYAPNLSRIGRMQARLQVYKDYLAPFVISASEEFPKSLESYLPLTLQKPTSHASQEYKVLAEHVHARVLRISAEKAAR